MIETLRLLTEYLSNTAPLRLGELCMLLENGSLTTNDSIFSYHLYQYLSSNSGSDLSDLRTSLSPIPNSTGNCAVKRNVDTGHIYVEIPASMVSFICSPRLKKALRYLDGTSVVPFHLSIVDGQYQLIIDDTNTNNKNNLSIVIV